MVRCRPSFISLEGFETALQRGVGCGGYMEDSVIRLVPGVDPLASLIVGAVEPIQARTCAEPLHGRADFVALPAAPETVIQDDIHTEGDTAHP
jgi:hypothetical protein